MIVMSTMSFFVWPWFCGPGRLCLWLALSFIRTICSVWRLPCRLSVDDALRRFCACHHCHRTFLNKYSRSQKKATVVVQCSAREVRRPYQPPPAPLPLPPSLAATNETRLPCLQVQLKGRFKVRRLSVRIADAHGRLVRTIRLRYHSKPVASLTDLRMPENAAKWRLAATVHVRFSFGTKSPVFFSVLGCTRFFLLRMFWECFFLWE